MFTLRETQTKRNMLKMKGKTGVLYGGGVGWGVGTDAVGGGGSRWGGSCATRRETGSRA